MFCRVARGRIFLQRRGAFRRLPRLLRGGKEHNPLSFRREGAREGPGKRLARRMQ